jgi:hypothetical protein
MTSRRLPKLSWGPVQSACRARNTIGCLSKPRSILILTSGNRSVTYISNRMVTTNYELAKSESPSRGRTIAYWVSTALVVFELGSGGAADVLRIRPVIEGITHLGYPGYFCVILGVWKILGAVALLAPRFPRLKEWAYAGTVFDLTGAAASHLAVGDSAIELIAPIVLTGLTFASWALRPPARRIGAILEQNTASAGAM